MSTPIGLFVVGAVVVTLGSTLLACRHLWGVAWQAWAKASPAHRRRLLTFVAVELLFVIGFVAVGIAAPWGPASIAYLLLGLAVVIIPVSLGGVAFQARRDIRAARERQAECQRGDDPEMPSA